MKMDQYLLVHENGQNNWFLKKSCDLAIDAGEGAVGFLSDTMYSVISFKKSSPPQNRRLNILICNSKQQVHYFVREFTKTNQ